ncbi:SEC-C metal-binding domain-containing protein, partial [Rhodococcus sp. NPDC058514]|uniref:SEC-C metal-binding domain-containing protein n=1 Tax=Rhodococcus sp. NPDC058514 TaxID=3346532 RepID=UPI003648F3E2
HPRAPAPPHPPPRGGPRHAPPADQGGEFSVVFGDFDDDRLAERGVSDPDFLYDEGLLLAPAALAGCAAGDLVAITVADGRLALRRVTGELAQAPDLTEALARIVPAGTLDNLDSVVWQLMVEDAALFRGATAPLGELIEAAGYVRDGDYLAAAGFDFAEHHLQTRVGIVAREYELHPDEARAVVEFLGLVRRTHDQAAAGIDPADYVREQVSGHADTYAALGDQVVAAAALDVVTGYADTEHALHAAAVGLAELGSRRLRAPAGWLAGKAADQLGDVTAAIEYYEECLDRDPEWVPAIFDLALLAADAGDVTRAQSLLGRIEDGESEPLHDVLARFQPREHPGLGRNDRCWCGSGRKYKACHLGKSELSPDDRAAWLYSKALLFMRTPELFDGLYELAEARTAYWDEVDAETMGRALEGGLVVDVGLFEGGVLALYVARRAVLLPPEDFELARQWLGTQRSVFEVIATAADVLTLRDLRGGATVEVRGEWGSSGIDVGSVVCARPLPTGPATLWAPGGVEPVAASDVDELLALLDAEDADPVELVEFLSTPLALD